MIPRLPVELLSLVLDNFRLPSFSSYRRTLQLENETRLALYNLCLASHTFRQIAQPLLYRFIRIESGKQFQELLGSNGSSYHLEHVNTLAIGHEVDITTLWSESREFRSFLREIIEIIVHYQEDIYQGEFVPQCLSGSMHLTRLFLNNLGIDSETAALSFPALEVLNMPAVTITSGSDAVHCFPALRHVAIHDPVGLFDGEDMALLRGLAPQLDSAILQADVCSTVLSGVPSVEVRTTLFNLAWNQWTRFKISELVHLRLLVTSARISNVTVSLCEQVIDAFTSTLETHCPNLESLYLPPFDSLPPDFRTDQIVRSLRKLALTCQQRNIDVILEEQSDEDGAESQVSEEFMRRMTKKRIESEASDGAGKDQ